MGLRRVAAGDQRRRRVLIEESLNLVGEAAESDRERPPVARLALAEGTSYSEAASLECQSPSVIVLASRPFTLTVAALSALVLLVGLLAAYAQWGLWPQGSLPALLLALDLQRPGSLAGWIGSLLLVAAAFQSFQIYRLRRHKTDDYRGRYRVWAWIPLVLLAMAAGQATGVHRDLIGLTGALLAPKTGSVHAATWPLLAAVSWLVVAVRLGLEIRVSRWATAFLAMATFGYAAGLVIAQIPVQPISQMLIVLGSSAFRLTSHLGVLVSVLVFGRHVYLDSQGLLPARTAKPRRIKSQVRDAVAETKKPRRKTADDSDKAQPVEKTETTAPEPQCKPERQPESPSETPPETGPDADVVPVLRWQADKNELGDRDLDEDSEASGEKLSKTERRRLKKLRQQEQMRRAA
jgi:hypothetical protein